MKNCKNNSRGFLRLLGITLSAVLLLSTVTAFAGAKAALKGGSLYFEKLIETKEETVAITKATDDKIEEVKKTINVEYIESGSQIVLEGANDLDGSIIGVLRRHEFNEKGTHISKSTVEATIAGDRVYVGSMAIEDITGILPNESIGVSFNNTGLPGATLGDENALYELQLLFTPKTQNPFFYTYYLRLVSAPDEKTENVTNNKTNTNTTNTANNMTIPAVKTMAENKLTVLPSSTKTKLNGKEIYCELYNINNHNYIKLRDFAMILNNTPMSFSVRWTEAQNIILINSRAEYTPTGGELVLSKQYISGGKTPASPTKLDMLLDNSQISLDSYNINGNTYFKVRDLSKLMNVSLQYDDINNVMIFNTDKTYIN